MHRKGPGNARRRGREQRQRASGRHAGETQLDRFYRARSDHHHIGAGSVGARAHHIGERIARDVHPDIGSQLSGAGHSRGHPIRSNHELRPEPAGQQHVQHAHHTEPDHEHSIARADAGAMRSLDHARQRLNKRGGLVGERVGDTQHVGAYDLCRNDGELGESTGVELGPAKRRAMHVIAAPAESADQAGSVMVHEDAILRRETRHTLTRAYDLGHRLMSGHQRRLARHVPTHRLTRAQAAGADAHQELTRLQRGQGHFFQTQVFAGVIDDGAGSCYSHARASGRMAYFTPLPRSREAKTSTMLVSSFTPVTRGRTSMVPLASN